GYNAWEEDYLVLAIWHCGQKTKGEQAMFNDSGESLAERSFGRGRRCKDWLRACSPIRTRERSDFVRGHANRRYREFTLREPAAPFTIGLQALNPPPHLRPRPKSASEPPKNK
ncbi:MAG: hypothetical protein AB8H12_18390, partial [Lewinella sp.]